MPHALAAKAYQSVCDDTYGISFLPFSQQCNYGAVVLLDGIVMILAVILNPRAARRRKALLTSSAENEKGEPSSASSTTALGQEDHSPIEQGRERIEAAASRSDRMPGESGRELETVEERSREILSPMARHLDV